MKITNEKPKILIVDDKPANLLSLRGILADVAADIVEASSGQAALTQCLYHDFAMILLDVHMPLMDGYEVSQNLRALEQTHTIPILFLTATYGQEDYRRKAYDVGAVDFILKPIDPLILLSKVNVFLELYNHRRIHEIQAIQLSEKNSRLEAEILERQRVEHELILAKDVAEQANLSKSRFLATMSHEIRTPMNGILGFAQLLAKGELTPKQKLYVDTILDSGATLLTVINDILDFSKIEAKKVILESIAFNPLDESEKAVRLFLSAAQKKGVELLLHPAHDLPTAVMGDPNRLRQVLHNLLSNAVKFTEQGSIDFSVKIQAVDQANITLIFLVKDTGIGIPYQAQTRLFEAFEQVDSSTTRKYGGTGLGLSICAGLAKLMGGRIEIESELGKGSLFRFTVPFSKLTANQSAAVAPVEHVKRVDEIHPDSNQPPHILIAEDDPINQMFIEETLTALGYTHLTLTGNGQETLIQWEKGDFALILMDCQMPIMDGLQTTKEIRSREAMRQGHGRQKHIPIIALTASVMHDERRNCVNAGMDDFLSKPVDAELLDKTIRHWLTVDIRATNRSVPNEPEPVAVPILSLEDIAPLNQEEWQKLKQFLGENSLRQLTKAFLDSLPNKLATIREGASMDTLTLHRRVHAFKGNCGMIKADAMYTVCQQLTSLCHSGSNVGAIPLVDQLEAEAKRLIPILKLAIGLNSAL